MDRDFRAIQFLVCFSTCNGRNFRLRTRILDFFSVNANAESLRSHFVAHEEQKELTIVQATGNRYNADYGALANQMSHLIHENVRGSMTWN